MVLAVATGPKTVLEIFIQGVRTSPKGRSILESGAPISVWRRSLRSTKKQMGLSGITRSSILFLLVNSVFSPASHNALGSH